MPIRKPASSIDDVEQESSVKKYKRDEPKGLVVRQEASGLYTLVYTAGGETPDKLKGFFTSASLAGRAAAVYEGTYGA